MDGFLEYAIKDVELLKKIDDKLQCINFAIQLQILSAVPYLNDIISVTKLIDSLLFKTFWDKNIIFPNNKPKKRVNYKGAIVMNPAEPGVHNDVYILDYSSLYPTTIMAFNISPETYLFSA
ncbi:MAG TPA: DNA polymerase domain-containing protein [Bacteroidales bacterium]|nr:DNA polymerase domain-containing protein [Bacteroidales bacterium]HQL12224.1 DNA polymerase domain-containing protein [bacterium]HRR51882.1 DNA polymerase domain-containing protein [Bacteroidales bacterium]